MIFQARNGVVVAATAVLLAIAAAPWLLPLNRLLPQPSLTVPPAAANKGAPLANLMEPPAIETFSAMIQRPLFAASRRAPDQTPSVSGKGPMLFGRYRLSGVVVTEGRRLALLVDGKGQHVSVEEGGELDGWRLQSVSPRRLVFAKGGERLEHILAP